MKQPTFKKLILGDLKAAGHLMIAKKIKSVTYETYSGGCTVNVKALCLRKKEREILENLLEEYKYGSFDGMTDLYSLKEVPSTKLRTAKHVFLNNEWTKEIVEAAWLDLKKKYGKEIENDCLGITGRWKDQLIWEYLNNL